MHILQRCTHFDLFCPDVHFKVEFLVRIFFIYSYIGPSWISVTLHIPYLADATGNDWSRHHYSSILHLLPGSAPSSCPAAFWTQKVGCLAWVSFRECYPFSEWIKSVLWLRWKEQTPHLSTSSIQRTLCIHSEHAKHSQNGAFASRGISQVSVWCIYST